MIEKVVRNILDYPSKIEQPRGKNGVLKTTGPIAFTLAINQYILEHSLSEGGLFRHIDSSKEGFCYSIFEESGMTLTHSHIFDSGGKGSETGFNNDASQYSKTHYVKRSEPIVIPGMAAITNN